MNGRLVCLWIATALAACATSPRPHFAAPVKDVTTGDQTQYWLMRPDSIPHDMPAGDGCFQVQAVIDSDGRVFQPKVLAVVGSGFAAWIPTLLPKLHFDPAPGNSARTPIRTVLTWTFNYSVSTQTMSAVSEAAAVKAMMVAGPPPDASQWGSKCKAEMDEQKRA